MVGVAQLVEHLVVAQDAAGSSPVTHPIKKKYLGAHAPFFIFQAEAQTLNTPAFYSPRYFPNLIKNICLLAYFCFL